jgi:ABC-type uncharacterized transport system auxiliary subunit
MSRRLIKMGLMNRRRMNRLIFTVVVLAVQTLLLSGCTQLLGGKAKIPQTREFIIMARPINLPFDGSGRPYPYRVQINKLQVPPRYERNQIVFRISEYELKKDRIHTWSARPSEMLTDAVDEYFSEARLFALSSRDFLTTPDFTFTGSVQAIERFDSDDEWRAHLAMSMRLVAESTKQVLWEANFDGEKVVYHKDMAYTVEMLNEILRERMQQYLADIDFKLLNYYRAQQGLAAIAAKPQVSASRSDSTQTKRVSHGGEIQPEDASYIIFPGKRMPVSTPAVSTPADTAGADAGPANKAEAELGQVEKRWEESP